MGNEKLGGGGEIQKKTPNTGPGLPDNHPNVIKAKEDKKKGGVETKAKTKEEIEIEKLFHELEVAAKKVQADITLNGNTDYELQKARGDIKVEKTQKGFIVISFGEKTEIEMEKIENSSQYCLSIRNKGIEVYSIGKESNTESKGYKVPAFKMYNNNDLYFLISIANIVNYGIYLAKQFKNKDVAPFSTHTYINTSDVNISEIRMKKPESTKTYRGKFLDIDAINNMLAKNTAGVYIKNINAEDILKRLTTYMNLKFFEEVTIKEK